MSAYRVLLLCVLNFVILSSWAVGQDEPQKAPESSTTTVLADTGFPKSWEGHWKGEAESISGNTDQKFNIELIVKATEKANVYQWTLIYEGPAGKQERPYKLLIIDAEKREFAIDEQNGIVLPAKLLHDTLFTHFSIQGMRLLTRSKLLQTESGEAVIEQEIVSFDETDKRETGSQDGVPPVSTWLAINLQRAKLKRAAK